MTRPNPHRVRDSLVSDACDAQRAQGKVPAVADNARYIEGVLARLDHKRAASKPRQAKQRPQRRRPRPRPGLLLPASLGVPLSEFDARLRKRLRLIRSRPEWAAKIKAINPLAVAGHLGPGKKQEATILIWKVLEESNAVWGDWKRPEPDGPVFFDQAK